MPHLTQNLQRAWRQSNIRALRADLSAARALLSASVSLRYQWTLIQVRQLRREATLRLQRFVDAYRFRPQ